METGNLIRSGDFCEIVTDKFIHENVKRGHIVYVGGHKALPEDEADPYTQRVKFLCQLVKEDHVDLKGIYIIDPRSLLKVSDSKQKHLTAVLKEDFDENSTN